GAAIRAEVAVDDLAAVARLAVAAAFSGDRDGVRRHADGGVAPAADFPAIETLAEALEQRFASRLESQCAAQAGTRHRARHRRPPVQPSIVFSVCAGMAAIVNRETQTSWPRSLRISMFHTWLDRPMCTGRAVPVTTSPSGTGRR